MKTLATILFITISTLTYSQNSSNQVNLKIEKEEGINILKWESNREINTSYYIVEKSVNGSEYKILGTQKAGSSTYIKSNYSFEDVEELQENTSYKITLVFMDGSTIATLENPKLENNYSNLFVK